MISRFALYLFISSFTKSIHSLTPPVPLAAHSTTGARSSTLSRCRISRSQTSSSYVKPQVSWFVDGYVFVHTTHNTYPSLSTSPLRSPLLTLTTYPPRARRRARSLLLLFLYPPIAPVSTTLCMPSQDDSRRYQETVQPRGRSPNATLALQVPEGNFRG